LSAAGFACERVSFSAPDTPDIDNLYARIGTQAPCLMFAGHTDVVPPGDAAHWRFPPFSAEVTEGQLWGRGAVDMKGGLAASMAAAIAHVATHRSPKGSIAFLITGDEEGPAVNGTAKLLDWAKARGETFDHCILGEPTNPDALGDMIKIGRRGSLTGRLTIHGKQGHVGYPHLADNPVPRMVRVLAALKALQEEGAVTADTVAQAIAKYGIKADKINPLHA
jgi:succinyl-diaminopimelate desuccinylase